MNPIWPFTRSEVLVEDPPKLSIRYGQRGEIIVQFPDGTSDHTDLIPSDREQAIFEEFFQTTVGRSYLMSIHEQATLDGLTELLRQQPGRVSIEQMLGRLKTIRFDGVVSVLMLDLDHFSQVNKKHGGNPAGDQVLQWFANIMKQSVRLGDILVRWGGEEFIIVAVANNPTPDHAQRDRDQPYSDTARSQTGATLPHIHQILGNGKMIGERIRSAMQRTPCFVPNGTQITQTVTIGVASAYIKPDHGVDDMFNQLFTCANDALYRGKETDRRDHVHVAPMIYGRPRPISSSQTLRT
ncbi:MAG: GGDEF domain-containing protein [Candidatus Uhrbacteria bacterium]|nr:GGDEF domain-containing protein [Candidatus Uhrbacteria bacterium]